MSRIGVVAAMEREVLPLVRHWQVTGKEYAGRHYSFFVNGDVVIVCGGIGADAARRAAEALMALFSPQIVYSVGFAGALDSTAQVAEVLRPGRVVNASDGSRVEIAGGSGVLVSFGSIASPEQKEKLREAFGATAVDMEAAAVARAAEARGVAFAAVKAISDPYDFVFPSTERFIDAEGRFHEGRFALFVALQPWLWLKVSALARNSNRAARALCDALRKVVLSKSQEPERRFPNPAEIEAS
jgi:adenosylhomocysteine nucleosidase